MSLDLQGELHQGLTYPVYRFNADNPILMPVELVELSRQMESGAPTRLMIQANGYRVVVWSAEQLLMITFGVFLASREEKTSCMAVVEGSVHSGVRATKGAPVFVISGTIEQKIKYLDNLSVTVPRDIAPPFTIRYLDHEVELDSAYELDNVRSGLRLCRRP